MINKISRIYYRLFSCLILTGCWNYIHFFGLNGNNNDKVITHK